MTVSPVGDAAVSGTALLDALASISTATAIDPCLLKIQPGIYDLGPSTLQMKSFVDVEGSGQNITTIKADNTVIETENNTEIRQLTVANLGAAPQLELTVMIRYA